MPEGRKDDSGKVRWDLIPRSLLKVVEVYTMGAGKYTERNWEHGLAYGRVFAALMRHAWKWWWGERYDEVDGQEHLASVVWCALALMEYQETHPELDDRPYKSAFEPGQKIEIDGDPRDYRNIQLARLVPGGRITFSAGDSSLGLSDATGFADESPTI